MSESELRELKETAIKKILAKESLDMKIISLQISRFLLTKIMTLSSWRQKSGSKGRVKRRQ